MSFKADPRELIIYPSYKYILLIQIISPIFEFICDWNATVLALKS